MTRAELERRLALLEAFQRHEIILELPEKRYEPAYPPNPVRRLFREVLDTTP